MEDNNQTTETSVTESATEQTETSSAEERKAVDPQTQIQEMMVEMAKLKRATDKATAEASEYKKKWKASMTDQEQASLEKAEAEAKRDEEFQSMRRELQINRLEKSYLAMGFTSDEASKMATAEADGDFDAKMKIMADVDARKKKSYEAEWLKTRPSVNAGVGGEESGVTKEQFDKMGYLDRKAFKEKFPETYKQYVQ